MAAPEITRTALVLYGSETGNAQDLAEELGRATQRLRFSTEVLSLDAVEPDVLNSYSVVFITISTTGQGELPTNARRFWRKLLRKKLPPTYLASTNLGVFGLGDSSYPQYNWAALKLHKRLRQLGASDLVSSAKGDEQHSEGYDAAFIPFLQDARRRLSEKYPLPPDQEPIPENVLLQPPYLLESVERCNTYATDATGDRLVKKELPPVDGPDTYKADNNTAFEVTLDQNVRITSPEHFQDVRKLVLHTSRELLYQPGDVLTIYPRNALEDIEQVLDLMHWHDAADIRVIFAENESYNEKRRPARPRFSHSTSESRPQTLREILTSHLDLNAIPRRSFFSLIAHFTSDEFQKERLLEFANPDLVDELFDYTTRPRRSILEVLQEFDSLSIPWQWAAAILPTLRGRQFSIASGGPLKDFKTSTGSWFRSNGTSHGTRFELLVAIVKYRTVIKKIRRGVCTRYLEGLQAGAQLQVTLQKGALGITAADLHRPVVMVGPGTGLAPIRALIWERWAHTQQRGRPVVSSGKAIPAVAPSVLFFGCRGEKADYYFRDEWESLQQLGMLLIVFTAFSRDQGGKQYVQDRIREQDELLYKLLFQQDGIVFVCGSSGRMPQAVRGALVEVLQKGGSMSSDQAEMQLKSMEKVGRYKQETW